MIERFLLIFISFNLLNTVNKNYQKVSTYLITDSYSLDKNGKREETKINLLADIKMEYLVIEYDNLAVLREKIDGVKSEKTIKLKKNKYLFKFKRISFGNKGYDYEPKDN